MKLEDLQVYQISVTSNISEGYGRFHYKDHKNFLYFSRGSLSETKTWLTKAVNRKLISEEKFLSLIERYNSLGVKLNNYINTIGNSGNTNSNDNQ